MDERLQAAKASVDDLLEPRLKWKIGALNLLREIRSDGDTVFLEINLGAQLNDLRVVIGGRGMLQQ